MYRQQIQITELRKNISRFFSKIKENESLNVLSNGKIICTALNPIYFEKLAAENKEMKEKIESLEETLIILSDNAMMKSLKKSIEELKQGKIRKWEDVFGEEI
jgi:hypothetical protein